MPFSQKNTHTPSFAFKVLPGGDRWTPGCKQLDAEGSMELKSASMVNLDGQHFALGIRFLGSHPDISLVLCTLLNPEPQFPKMLNGLIMCLIVEP